MKLARASNEKKQKSIETQIRKVEFKITKMMEKKDKIVAKQKIRAIYAYIQFRSMAGKDRFLNSMNVSLCERFWILFCGCCCKEKKNILK